MGSFSIKTDRASNLAEEIGGYHSRLVDYIDEINGATSVISGETSLNIEASINRINDALAQDLENLFTMKTALERIIQRYINAENKNCRKTGGSGTGQNNGENTAPGEHRYHRDNGWEDRKEGNSDNSNSQANEETTDRMENTGVSPEKRSDEEILDEIQERFDSFRDKKNSWRGKCGALTYWQLERQGLVGDNDSTLHGKDLARKLAEMGETGTGHPTTGYYVEDEDPSDVFDRMIYDHNGSVDNIVLSFDHGTDGHAMLISKIEDGKVYFMDNWSNYSDGNGGYVPQVLTVEEFKERYFSWAGYSCNCMTVVS